MAEPQTDPNAPLSDDYLKAHATDPEVAPYLSSEERRRLSRLTPSPTRSAVSNAEPGTYWSGFFQSLKDQLREAGTGLKPMLESAAHPQTLSDFAQLLMPSGMVGAGAKGAGAAAEAVDAATGALCRVRAAAAAPAEAFLGRTVGLDPAAIDLQAARMRLQAARSRTRQATMAGDLETAQRADVPESAPSTPAPSAASADTAPPPVPTPSQARRARAAGSTPPASAPRSTTPVNPAMEEIDQRMSGGADMPTKGNGAPAFDLNSLSKEEQIQAVKWYEAGMPPEKILQNIETSRKLTGRLGTPTPEEAARAVAERNRTGHWQP